MILDVHLQKFLYIQLSQLPAYVFVRPRGHWSTYQETFVILVNTLIFLKNKADIRTKEKSWLRPA